jgi:crotonobetainyl-CoA:carnitine CoA-transferase CaiB-like acyl-CoA transferase
MSAGLAWRTGEPDRRPVIPNGPCDPVAGGHATVALLLALEHRRRTGEGMFVECPMIGGALNIAAEQVVEHSAYGARLDRLGTRAEHVAPQGVYLSADPGGSALPGPDRWVAVSVTDDEQWRGLQRALGSPEWAAAPALATLAGRQAAHDVIDAELIAWVGARPSAEAVSTLLAEGVPAAVVVLPHETGEVEQLVARKVFTRLEHPVTGPVRYIGLAGKLSNGPEQDVTSPAPTLGQHNHDVLVDELGLSEDEYSALERDGIIGTTTGTAAAW